MITIADNRISKVEQSSSIEIYVYC